LIETIHKKNLIVICGPTAVGKTSLAVSLGEALDAEIISADSRQFYKELRIGVAIPSEAELKAVKHHFISHLSITDYYNVSRYENDVIDFLQNYFKYKNAALMVGGSGLYIDAVCKGIDVLPDIDEDIRIYLKTKFIAEGLDPLREELKMLDPDYYRKVDLQNPNRIIRALEVCLITGKPYSAFRIKDFKPRDFKILRMGLDRPRSELFEIIEQRVDRMIEEGLVDEVKDLISQRNLNALNTVGYKEIFQFLDGNLTLDEAIDKIKTHTRRYAKRQLTWFKRDGSITWFHPEELERIRNYIKGIFPDQIFFK
jgi:tRNA dimethylallyltransferase